MRVKLSFRKMTPYSGLDLFLRISVFLISFILENNTLIKEIKRLIFLLIFFLLCEGLVSIYLFTWPLMTMILVSKGILANLKDLFVLNYVSLSSSSWNCVMASTLDDRFSMNVCSSSILRLASGNGTFCFYSFVFNCCISLFVSSSSSFGDWRLMECMYPTICQEPGSFT